jgi:glycosyltransferase involved in cell wall biosynthesis
MRVLHVVPSLAARAGGSAIGVAEASAALTRAGVESIVYSTDLRRSVRPEELADALQATEFRLFRTRPPRRWVYSPSLARGLREASAWADVVHVHLLHLFPTLAACRAARRAETPYVVAPCGSLDRAWRTRSTTVKAATDRIWQREALNRAAILHYKTQQEKDEAADLALAPPAWVVPNGYPVLGRGTHRQRSVAAGHPRVLFLGRISYKKRIDLLLDAFREVLPGVPGARLTIAGPDDEGLSSGLQQLARRLGIANTVTFLGQVEGEQKRALFESADVFVLPSTAENFGISVVEALALGVPTVATPGVAIAREAANEGAAVIADDSVGGVSSALLRLLRDERLRTNVSRAGLAFSERFTWPKVVPRLTEMYEAAVRGARA